MKYQRYNGKKQNDMIEKISTITNLFTYEIQFNDWSNNLVSLQSNEKFGCYGNMRYYWENIIQSLSRRGWKEGEEKDKEKKSREEDRQRMGRREREESKDMERRKDNNMKYEKKRGQRKTRKENGRKQGKKRRRKDKRGRSMMRAHWERGVEQKLERERE